MNASKEILVMFTVHNTSLNKIVSGKYQKKDMLALHIQSVSV
jgi:hypothetical protein